MGRAKRICYLSPMPAAKVQASLRIRAVSPEPPLLAHTSSESRGTFRQKARSLVPLNGWACAIKICHDGMLGDTNSLDSAQIFLYFYQLKSFHRTLICFIENLRGFQILVERVPEKKKDNLDYIPENRFVCYTHTNPTPLNKTMEITCTSDVVGNQVRLQVPNRRAQIILCDFRLYGGKIAYFNMLRKDRASTEHGKCSGHRLSCHIDLIM